MNLNNNGVFYNADVILGSNDYLQNKYLEKKIDFMKNWITAVFMICTLGAFSQDNDRQLVEKAVLNYVDAFLLYYYSFPIVIYLNIYNDDNIYNIHYQYSQN